MNRWINKAVEEAKRSEYKMKIGCVIFNKGRFVSSGYNQANRSVKSHHPKFRKTEFSIHAEVDAILKAKTDLKGMSILIIRINNRDEFRLSKPCKYCMAYLNHVGIKKCYYSISSFPYIEKIKL